MTWLFILPSAHFVHKEVDKVRVLKCFKKSFFSTQMMTFGDYSWTSATFAISVTCPDLENTFSNSMTFKGCPCAQEPCTVKSEAVTPVQELYMGPLSKV